MNKMLLVTFFLVLGSIAFGQKKPLSEAKLSLKYEIIGEGGYNGCTVTYNPSAQVYFCAFAGNTEYPLEVFNTSGDYVSGGITQVDMRGMWYNSKNNTLEGTMYGGGTYVLYLNNGYEPAYVSYPDNSDAFVGPEDQSVAAGNPVKGEFYCYSSGSVYVYSQKNNQLKKTIVLKNCPSDWGNMNSVSMIYTGYKNSEFGLWDYVNYQVHLFSAKGVYRQSISFPTDAPIADMFRFGFANDRIWLFDPDSRTWYGYKAFE